MAKIAGYWSDYLTARAGNPDTNWSDFFYERPFGNPYADMSPDDFLHGHCNVFAMGLHKKFGYPIEAIMLGKNLVHAYCTAVVDGEYVFIDSRGCTTDYEMFVDEFLDYIELDEYGIEYPVCGTMPKQKVPRRFFNINDIQNHFPRYINAVEYVCNRMADYFDATKMKEIEST